MMNKYEVLNTESSQFHKVTKQDQWIRGDK
jgi:hypothetical protein